MPTGRLLNCATALLEELLMATRKKTRLEKAQDKLRKALKRLDVDQGQIARRNARIAVTAAQRQLKTAMDADYPVIRKTPKRTGKLSPGVKRRRLEQAGYVKASVACVRICEQANVPTKTDGNWIYIPGWAIEILDARGEIHRTPVVTARLLERARKPSARKGVRAELAVRRAQFSGLDGVIARKAIARIKRDTTFRNAILAAAAIDSSEVTTVVKAVMELLERQEAAQAA